MSGVEAATLPFDCKSHCGSCAGFPGGLCRSICMAELKLLLPLLNQLVLVVIEVCWLLLLAALRPPSTTAAVLTVVGPIAKHCKRRYWQ